MMEDFIISINQELDFVKVFEMQNKDFQPEPSEITICNKCGKTCMKGNKDIGGDIEDPYGLIDVVYSGGYFSSQEIGDEVVYHFSICEECLHEFMKSFKISAKVGHLHENKIEQKYYPEVVKNRERAQEMILRLSLAAEKKKNDKPN